MDQWERTLHEFGFAVTKISPDFEESDIEIALGIIDVMEGIRPIQTLVPRPVLGVAPAIATTSVLAHFPFIRIWRIGAFLRDTLHLFASPDRAA